MKSKVELLTRLLLAGEIKPFVKNPELLFCGNISLVINCWCYYPELLGKSYRGFLDYHCGMTKENLSSFRRAMKETGWCTREQSDEWTRGTAIRTIKRITKTMAKLITLRALIMRDFNFQRNFTTYVRACMMTLATYQVGIQSVALWNRCFSAPPPRWSTWLLFGVAGLCIRLEKPARRRDLTAFVSANLVFMALKLCGMDKTPVYLAGSAVMLTRVRFLQRLVSRLKKRLSSAS
mmetsp:Transcript_9187/g.22560  ORF Transcript_9187/g.22560 Transcript_9187/m.22560 type:complete len:235 (-) Transcript_9187:91-795(-)